MEISRRTDYAIRMMMALAESDGRPVSVRVLAARQGVPYSFARAVQRDLSAAGLVIATRGACGGIRLARDAMSISLLDIVAATQGGVAVADCVSDPGTCGRSAICSVNTVLREADGLVRDLLMHKTLTELTAGR